MEFYKTTGKFRSSPDAKENRVLDTIKDLEIGINPVVQAFIALFGTIFVLFGIRDLATDIFWGVIAFWLGIAWCVSLYWYLFVYCPAAFEEHLNRLFDDRRR